MNWFIFGIAIQQLISAWWSWKKLNDGYTAIIMFIYAFSNIVIAIGPKIINRW
jgi:uncharacterized membrane protein YccC